MQHYTFFGKILTFSLCLFLGNSCQQFSSSIWDPIPVTVPFIFTVSAPESLSGFIDGNVGNDNTLLREIGSLQEIYNQLEALDTSRKEKPILMGLYPITFEEYGWFTIFDLQYFGKDLDFLRQQAKAETQTNFRGKDIFHLDFDEVGQYTFCQRGNLLMVGKLSLMVEEAIRQLADPVEAWRKRSDLANLFKDYPNTDLQLYINGFALGDLSESEIFPLDHLTDYYGWYRLDFSQQEGQWTVAGELSGALRRNPEENLENQKQRRKVTEILPDNVAFLLRKQSFNLTELRTQLSLTEGNRLEELFLPWMEQDFTYVLTDPVSFKPPWDHMLVFPIKHEGKERAFLEKIANNAGVVKTYNYLSFDIIQIRAEQFFKGWMGSSYEGFQNPSFVSFGDYVVFASQSSSLELLIDYYVVGKTLSAQAGYLSVEPKDNGEASLFWYADLKKLYPLLNNSRAFRSHNTVLPFFQRFQELSLALGTQEEDRAIWGRLNTAQRNEEDDQVLWRSKLDSEVQYGPQRIPLNNGGWRMAIQDGIQRLYWLDETGTILWKRQISGPILSPIHLIDYYKDEQQQLLFNTRDEILALDQNGKDIGSFPITLRTKAISGIAVIDFDQNREYQMFVGSENGGIIGFDKRGVPLKKWNPKDGVGMLPFSLTHFQHKNKDFLTFVNEDAQWQFLERNGTPHFPPVEMKTTASGPPSFQLFGNTGRMVAPEKDGVVQVRNLKGDGFALRLAGIVKEDKQFLFEDVIGDERKDYIAWGANELLVYYYDGDEFKRYMSLPFESSPDALFAVDHPNKGKKWLGWTIKAKQQIWLLDVANLDLHPDFPLAGTATFFLEPDISSNALTVITGHGSRVVSYRVSN